SLRALFDTDFATAVAIVAVPLIAFLASMVFLAGADDTGRYRWAAAALFAGAGLLSMALHSRAAAGAGAMAVPIVACLATRIARRRQAERASVSLPLLVAIVPFVSFLAWHLAATALVPLLASRF